MINKIKKLVFGDNNKLNTNINYSNSLKRNRQSIKESNIKDEVKNIIDFSKMCK